MDFTPEAAAAAVAEATDEVVSRLTPDWTCLFTSTEPDLAAWGSFVDAGLTVLALPEDCGGAGLSAEALVPLAGGAGRAATIVPLIGTLTAGAALAQKPEAAERWAPALTAGRWCAAAVAERGRSLGAAPQARLADTGQGLRLHGTKTGVVFAEGAAALVVTAQGGVVVVDPQAPGVSCTRTPSSTGAAEYTVVFDDVAVGPEDVLAANAQAVTELYRVLLAAYADGLLAGAMAMTAAHVTEREQFGKPIAAFQAVGQQLADVYVVSRTLNLIVTAAAWRLATGRAAAEDLATADYWLAAELPAALRAMTHLHGGVGVDLSYPLHRYFSLAKDLARLTGGPGATLDALADATVADATVADATVADATVADATVADATVVDVTVEEAMCS